MGNFLESFRKGQSMGEEQRNSAEHEIKEDTITKREAEMVAQEETEEQQVQKQEEVEAEKKTGFLSRETLYSRINISLKSMDRFIAILIVLLIVLLGVGIFS